MKARAEHEIALPREELAAAAASGEVRRDRGEIALPREELAAAAASGDVGNESSVSEARESAAELGVAADKGPPSFQGRAPVRGALAIVYAGTGASVRRGLRNRTRRCGPLQLNAKSVRRTRDEVSCCGSLEDSRREIQSGTRRCGCRLKRVN